MTEEAGEISATPSSMRKTAFGVTLPPVIGIFLTVFLDLLSFGMFLPDLQLRGHLLGAKGITLGALIGVYSLAQLVTAPILGRISDGHGRRSVLLITTFMSTAAYAIYAHGHTLWIVLIARVLLGVAGASVGVAFAYMADVTKPEERAKGLGLLGAAFGLGFILGPVAGGLLLKAGHDDPLLLGYAGAALSLINFLYVWLLLPDSAPSQKSQGVASMMENFKVAINTPGLGILLLMFFAINFAFTNLETTYFLLLADPRSVFHYGFDTDGMQKAKWVGSIVLALVGVIGVFVQGFLIRNIMPKFGEVKILRFAYILMPIGLLLTPFCPLWFPGILVLLAIGFASGLSQPSLSSLISRSSPMTMQGGIFGITQSLGAVARLIGPLVSTPSFVRAPHLPYIIGAGLYLFPMAGSWKLKQPTVSEEPALEVVAG